MHNIKVRFKNPAKDNFFEFPKNLKIAFKMLHKKRCDIEKIIKLKSIKFVTFKNSSEYIEIKINKINT
tara:strand:- start:334 stop:537 length:204 start_codon:yes stop_codon:yes gene_type:complete